MKTPLKILFILISINFYSQNKEQKIIEILKSTEMIDGYKSYILDMTIRPLKNNVNKVDSLKLVNIENKLTDEEIGKRLSKAYSQFFTDKEIDDIFNFYKSSAGKKMIGSYGMLQEKFNDNFQDIQNELKPIIEKISDESKNEVEKNKEIPVAVDKEDGFYSVINFENQNDKLADLKLSLKPEVRINEILEIKKLKNELDYNVIDIILTKEGAKKFKILTENNIGKPIAIVLNKKLISAPRVMSEIPNGRIQISGNFTDEEIENIINAVKK